MTMDPNDDALEQNVRKRLLTTGTTPSWDTTDLELGPAAARNPANM